VLIAGAGPTGNALGLVLARANVPVLMVEQSGFDSPRVGELLSPDGVHVLSQMLPGLSEEHLQFALSVVSAWSTTELVTDQDATVLPWRAVDRVGLDRRLAQEAQAQGAELRLHGKLSKPRRDGEVWKVEVETQGRKERFTADYLIDATGRASSLAKHFGAVRLRQSGQVAVVGFLECAKSLEVPREMVLETTANGWWYAAPIMPGAAVAVFISDNDLDRGQPDHAWKAAFEASVHVKQRFGGHRLTEKPRRVAAESSLLLPSYGEGWMAVGDAAACFDPLSIHGLGRALLQGARVGQYLVQRFSAGEAPNPLKLAEENGEEFLKETLALSVWYRQVKHWPESLFWQRRDQGYPSVETGRQKRRPKSTRPPLLFVTEQRFECEQCGRCRRAEWPTLRQPSTGPPSEPLAFPSIGPRPDFCRLPTPGQTRMCGQFPFLLRETPDGIVVGASPLCRSVQSGRGKPLSHYADWVRDLVEQRPPAVLPRKVPVTWGRGIDWSEYVALEQSLMTSTDFDGALREMRWSLSLWACHPGQRKLADSGPERPDSFLAWLENLLVGALLCCLEHDPAANSSDLFRNLVDDKPVSFARVGWKGRFSELGSSKVLDDVDWICEETTHYQRALIRQKFLVIRTPLLHNLCLLSVLPDLLLTYALLLSMHRGASGIERQDYFRALELVEMELVTYGRLDQLPHIIASFHLDKALEHLSSLPV
jgi:flavin-dependent dehydrogenase